ncbi:hypothetical protein ASPFODRAFT_223649 [Aspergillus luchuensis CBS 106.47]|uniref:Uncharacterized protein n=1 Tax=Aspergillus luchuensis (strain CBS 106.47) TaxID=1137211 RepID=A0A1M3T0D8_ASPLC|nr:hypothetical protein ASPFODRAFT_223649 [Aspergillus luchuensis CBS 106.47]
MSESSLATNKPTEIGTEASTSLQATPGDPMSEPPPPYFQAWFMPGTGCEELSQHLPCISDGLPQASGKLAVSFDQPVPVLAFAANDPYYLVPQPIHDNTQAHEDKLIPEEGNNADHTKPEALCRKTGPRKSSCFEAQTRDGQAKYAATGSENPCLPCPLSELNDGMQDIPVRDMYAWVHRPVATRRQEARQRRQRIPRPLNSFILLSGQSWKMEAPHIRKEYETLAEMEKRNHATAHPGYRFSLSNKRGKSRTAKGHSQELALRLKAFSNFGQDSRPAAWAPSVDNNGACERSTGTFPEEEGTLVQRCSLSPDSFIPLGSAASVWEQWTSYPQTTSAEHGSKGTQPRLPVTTGQTEIPATACLVSQPAAPGIDAANHLSSPQFLSLIAPVNINRKPPLQQQCGRKRKASMAPAGLDSQRERHRIAEGNRRKNLSQLHRELDSRIHDYFLEQAGWNPSKGLPESKEQIVQAAIFLVDYMVLIIMSLLRQESKMPRHLLEYRTPQIRCMQLQQLVSRLREQNQAFQQQLRRLQEENQTLA